MQKQGIEAILAGSALNSKLVEEVIIFSAPCW